MAIIKVRTPNGVIQVRVAGDAPTEEESKAIAQSLSKRYSGSDALGGMAKPNFAQLTNDQLQDIGNFSRFGYGRMETDQERANYLTQKVGKDTFRKDPLGRFILTQKGRDSLGMGKGPEVSIDEEGLSWGDVKEFMGQAAVPTAAGIGAALTFSGVGTIPGILIAGAAAASAKALDGPLSRPKVCRTRVLAMSCANPPMRACSPWLGKALVALRQELSVG